MVDAFGAVPDFTVDIPSHRAAGGHGADEGHRATRQFADCKVTRSRSVERDVDVESDDNSEDDVP